MTEYITKAQALSAMRKATNCTWDDIWNTEYVLKSVPAADVAPVVRCKDCKYAEETYRPDIVRCTNFSTYHDPWKVWRGWYCGDGERKDGGESND